MASVKEQMYRHHRHKFPIYKYPLEYSIGLFAGSDKIESLSFHYAIPIQIVSAIPYSPQPRAIRKPAEYGDGNATLLDVQPQILR
jgi:hypothetical protein